MTFVDSHCHLDDRRFSDDREETIARAREAGVHHMMTIGTGEGPPDLEAAVRLAEKYPFVSATVGVHPHDASKVQPDTMERLAELAKRSEVAAIGEIGLDYHYDFSPRDQQAEVFRKQMEIARDARKPVVIHTREAWDDTFRMLEENWVPARLPGILHCFTGGPAEAERALAMGFSLGFGGVTTYPKALETQEAAKLAPLDRILLETDAPYLAPVPHRGKRNEPAYVVETARMIAKLRGIPLEEVARATTDNFNRMCGAASK